MIALALAPAFDRVGDSGCDGFQQRARLTGLAMDQRPVCLYAVVDTGLAPYPLDLIFGGMASTAVLCTRFSLCSTRHLLGGCGFFTIAWQLIQPPLGV